MIEGSGSIPLDPDPDPGGPKTCGSGGSRSGFGSGSGTVIENNIKVMKQYWGMWIRMFLGLLDPDPLVQRYRYGSGSDSFCHRAKIVRKTLIPIVLCDFFMIFLSLKNDGNVGNKEKNLEKKNVFFLLVLGRSKNSQIIVFIN
jgi:hypothetical protein